MNQDSSVDKLGSMVDERGTTFRCHETITFCKAGVCLCVCVLCDVCVWCVCVVCVWCVCVCGVCVCVWCVCVV